MLQKRKRRRLEKVDLALNGQYDILSSAFLPTEICAFSVDYIDVQGHIVTSVSARAPHTQKEKEKGKRKRKFKVLMDGGPAAATRRDWCNARRALPSGPHHAHPSSTLVVLAAVAVLLHRWCSGGRIRALRATHSITVCVADALPGDSRSARCRWWSKARYAAYDQPGAAGVLSFARTVRHRARSRRDQWGSFICRNTVSQNWCAGVMLIEDE